VLHNILITMGGVDQPNASGRVLQALAGCDLARSCRITVVMGSQAPWIEAVRSQAQRLPLRTEVVVSVDDMAQRMADSDLAIGAAGGTSWERCSVGVPTLLVELAANQAGGAAALAAAGAAIRLGQVDDIEFALPAALCALLRDDGLRRMSEAARAIVDGCGTQRILNAMEA
jgi:spore coat polysaccharide biosynthesis predicted glycosyltransferase SpsG